MAPWDPWLAPLELAKTPWKQIELLAELMISRMVPQQDTKDYEIKTPATKHQNSRSNALFAFQEEVPPRKGGIMKPIVEDGKTSKHKVSFDCYI